MRGNKIMSAEAVVRECFWGDYQISAEELLKRLEADEPGFDNFVFSKIIENSSYPSKHLRVLFQPHKIQALLERYVQSGGHCKRLPIIAANLSGNYEPASEYAWKV
jgi:hypothetical protein